MDNEKLIEEVEVWKSITGLEFISNGYLIDLLNSSGFIHEVDEWGLDDTCTREDFANLVSRNLIGKSWTTNGEQYENYDYYLGLEGINPFMPLELCYNVSIGEYALWSHNSYKYITGWKSISDIHADYIEMRMQDIENEWESFDAVNIDE